MVVCQSCVLLLTLLAVTTTSYSDDKPRLLRLPLTPFASSGSNPHVTLSQILDRSAYGPAVTFRLTYDNNRTFAFRAVVRRVLEEVHSVEVCVELNEARTIRRAWSRAGSCSLVVTTPHDSLRVYAKGPAGRAAAMAAYEQYLDAKAELESSRGSLPEFSRRRQLPSDNRNRSKVR